MTLTIILAIQMKKKEKEFQNDISEMKCQINQSKSILISIEKWRQSNSKYFWDIEYTIQHQ